MKLKTILNLVEPHKGFAYERVELSPPGQAPTLEISLRRRRRSRAVCSGCGQQRPGYDRLAPRRFEFVPLWGIAVFFIYAMRRSVKVFRWRGRVVEKSPGNRR